MINCSRENGTDKCCVVCTEYKARLGLGKERKGKEEYLYSAFYILCISQSAQAWITQFYLLIHHACLSFVSVHQMAPRLTEVRDIQLQLTTHLSTPKGWKALLTWIRVTVRVKTHCNMYVLWGGLWACWSVVLLWLSAPIGRGDTLMIVNVSQSDDDVYQCVAFNGVPPSSYRLIRVAVHCTSRQQI